MNLSDLVQQGIAPKIQVRAPDGTIIQFPAGTPNAQINSVMSAYHDGVQRAQSNERVPGTLALHNGMALGHAADIDAAKAALATGAKNLIGLGPGYGMKDAFNATKAAEQRVIDNYAAQHPVLNTAANVIGSVANPLSLAGGEWVNAAKGVLPAMGRAAAVGAAEGGIAGGLKGAAMGAAIGPAAVVGGAAVQKVAGAAAGVGRNLQRAAGVAKPEDVAAQRIAAALAKDTKAGVDPRANLQNWPGASQPTLADVGGENVRALVRDAGSQGPARQSLQTYRGQVAGDLQDHAINLTQGLVPGENRTAQQYAQALEDLRASNAQEKYAGPYAEPVQITPSIVSALRDQEGRAAVDRAIAGSRASMDYGAMNDLQNLRATQLMQGDAPFQLSALAEQPPPMTTGRALDRIQIAFGRTGKQLQNREDANDLAAGLFKRQGLINSALDEVPGLSEARADYRSLSNQKEGVDNGAVVLRTPPSAYAPLLDGATPEVMRGVQVGARQALIDALGSPTEGALGALNRISTSTNTGQNLAATFGDDAANAYRAGLQAEADRMSNANFMAPNTGSQTASKGHDLLAQLLHGGHAVLEIAKNAIGGGPLTDAERSAIVSPALQTPSDDLLSAYLAMKAKQPLLPASAYAVAPLAITSGQAVANSP